ncbi:MULTISPECIES: hypothetical protein [unclassified Lysinibacillus]|uniref:hypothetical protein n=1 Tax=unclassified Lysinibacillus TaxID=2636778 RepID=UPI00117144B1|nr:hypothetical protein [Lysinibacillus sp. CD3-6]QPQ36604.1 hypothetical protein JNUCC52_06685 [Lysinibacillus sp. JNUCC-52]UED81667.1 hypothetical protein FH508_0007180 [Lysinibacillus sp. CD3-6]
MNKVIIPILIVIIMTGCNAFPKGVFKQPVGQVILDGAQYNMLPSKFEWKEDDVEMRLKGSPDINEIADNFETLDVKKGEILKFNIEQSPIAITATKMNEDGTIENVEIKEEKITMPSKEGYYIYELDALWNNGKESFIFDVYVE